ncbi:MAG: long-chain acyl-CoA synthetase [Candidatus Azotimanducaceae bacterium]|jgi:long-chain acyl-CoA synthetase
METAVDYTQIDATDAAKTGMSLAVYAAVKPSEAAVVDRFGVHSWLDLNKRANQLADFIRKSELEPDDGIALLCSNRIEFIQVMMAAFRTGTRVTPINWHLTGEEIGYIVDNSDAKIFIAENQYLHKLEEVGALASKIQCSLSIGGAAEGYHDYQAELEKCDTENITAPIHGGTMLYTSGTTGHPKGVYREERPILLPDYSETGFNNENPVALCTGPAYHAAPLLIDVLTPIVSGATVVMMDKWDPEQNLALIATHKVTHCHMVATMFHRLLMLPEETRNKYDISSVKQIIHGAAPCPIHVKRNMINWFGPVLIEYYAATEGGGGFLVGSEEWLTKPGTVGRPGPEFDNKILDDDGNPVAVGETGTIYMHAPEHGRFVYYKDNSKTDSSYRGDYFTLGDMGYFDEDGYLFLTGRTAELIISGGVNIYPQEVDNEVMQHPAVHDVCSIGVPNEEWGEEVKSVVQLNPGHEPSEALAEDLKKFARERLPGFKCPKTIDFALDLPRLPTGKIQRRVVRAPYWAGRDKSI